MKKSKSDYELRQGLRIMVLLIIALHVAVFSYYDAALPVLSADAENQIAIWLNSDSENFKTGIWQIPAKTTFLELQALLGVQGLTAVPVTSCVQPFSTLSCVSNKLADHQNFTIHHKLSPLVFKPLSLNRSDVETLTTLDGIGVSLAEKIIKLRENIGKFESPDQLLQIKGIGEKSLVSLAGQVSVD